MSKTTKQGDVKGKTAEVKQIEVALSNYKEDHATLSDELSAVLTYLDKLKPQCETKAMSARGHARPSNPRRQRDAFGGCKHSTSHNFRNRPLWALRGGECVKLRRSVVRPMRSRRRSG